MNGEVWRSRDEDIVTNYADRLYPADDAEPESEDGDGNKVKEGLPKIAANANEEIDFRYMNGPPPKDLLNYMNMDIEMSLWAKTGTGWMSVWVLLGIIGVCFVMTYIVWVIRFTFFF